MLSIIADLIIVIFAILVVKLYLRIKGIMTEIDQIIGEAMTPEVVAHANPALEPETERLRERLIGVAEAGKSKAYLGKNITSTEIENLDPKELLKLYARYEVCIGGLVTKSMKQHFV